MKLRKARRFDSSAASRSPKPASPSWPAPGRGNCRTNAGRFRQRRREGFLNCSVAGPRDQHNRTQRKQHASQTCDRPCVAVQHAPHRRDGRRTGSSDRCRPAWSPSRGRGTASVRQPTAHSSGKAEDQVARPKRTACEGRQARVATKWVRTTTESAVDFRLPIPPAKSEAPHPNAATSASSADTATEL